MNNIDNKLDLLKEVKTVEAPEFLLTRIKQQINNLGSTEASTKWKWAFALATVIVLVLNLTILLQSASATTKKNTNIENLVNQMNLTTINDLYNE